MEVGVAPSPAFYGGNAVNLGGQPLVFNGESDDSPPLVGFAFVGSPGTDGRIDSYVTTNSVEELVRWRFAAAATSSHAYVLGGEVEAGMATGDVEMLSLTSSASSPILQAKALSPLPALVLRGSAAIARDTLVVYGGPQVYWTALNADGTDQGWSPFPSDVTTGKQFDGIAAADDQYVYLVGGNADGTAFSWVDCAQSPPALTKGTATLDLSASIATTSRGYVYILPDNSDTIMYAKLNAKLSGSLELQPGRTLPEVRRSAAMFVF